MLVLRLAAVLIFMMRLKNAGAKVLIFSHTGKFLLKILHY